MPQSRTQKQWRAKRAIQVYVEFEMVSAQVPSVVESIAAGNYWYMWYEALARSFRLAHQAATQEVLHSNGTHRGRAHGFQGRIN